MTIGNNSATYPSQRSNGPGPTVTRYRETGIAWPAEREVIRVQRTLALQIRRGHRLTATTAGTAESGLWAYWQVTDDLPDAYVYTKPRNLPKRKAEKRKVA